MTNFNFFSNYIIQKTGIGISTQPDVPYFEINTMPSENGLANFNIRWIPNVDSGKSGSHFKVKYRVKGEADFKETDPELDEDTVVVRGLDSNENYEFRVVAVDGNFMTESESKFVSTDGIGEFDCKFEDIEVKLTN